MCRAPSFHQSSARELAGAKDTGRRRWECAGAAEAAPGARPGACARRCAQHGHMHSLCLLLTRQTFLHDSVFYSDGGCNDISENIVWLSDSMLG